VPIRESYKDTYTGAADENIRRLLGYDGADHSRQMLRTVLLKVINNELTPRQKEIIMLYYFKGMDTTEISAALGISAQAVSAARARARLRIFRILRYYL
jgi:RNA polymerase sigma-70 factor (ECF subfamily)